MYSITISSTATHLKNLFMSYNLYYVKLNVYKQKKARPDLDGPSPNYFQKLRLISYLKHRDVPADAQSQQYGQDGSRFSSMR